MAKEHIDLIHIAENQTIADYYGTRIREYLSVWKDNFWYDDFYDAWKDDRVGGLRESLVSYEETAKSLSRDNFATYKQRYSEILRQRIELLENQAQTDAHAKKEKEELERRYQLLETSSDYVSYGSKVGSFKDYEIDANFDKYKRDIDMFTNNEDNRKQVNWTLGRLRSTINTRYTMIQGLVFAIEDGATLPLQMAMAKSFRDRIAQGIEEYEQHKEDGVYATEDGRTEWKNNLSFQNIRKYAHQAKGTAQAYDDALTAIKNSPKYDLMRQYFLKKEKEKRNPDYALIDALETGHDAKIDFYLSKHKLIPDINATGLFGSDGELSPILDNLVIPALTDLNIAETRYAFLSQKMNEFNEYVKTHPQELAILHDSESLPRDVFSISTDPSEKEMSACTTVMGLSDLLLSEDVLTKRAVEATKWGAVTAGSFLVPGGLLVTCAVGVTAGAAVGVADNYDKYGTCFPDENSTAEGPNVQNKAAAWLRDTWATNGFLSVKNSHVIDQIQKVVDGEETALKRAMKRIYETPIDDFDSALDYALSNASFSDRDILEIAKAGRELAKLSPEEFKKREEEFNREKADIEQRKAAGDESAVAEEYFLAREQIVFECAKSGMYFAVARRGLKYVNSVLGDQQKEHLSQFRASESDLLSGLATITSARVDAEYEADVRSELVAYWKNAGSPKETEQESLYSADNKQRDSGNLSKSLAANGSQISADTPLEIDQTYQQNGHTQQLM